MYIHFSKAPDPSIRSPEHTRMLRASFISRNPAELSTTGLFNCIGIVIKASRKNDTIYGIVHIMSGDEHLCALLIENLKRQLGSSSESIKFEAALFGGITDNPRSQRDATDSKILLQQNSAVIDDSLLFKTSYFFLNPMIMRSTWIQLDKNGDVIVGVENGLSDLEIANLTVRKSAVPAITSTPAAPSEQRPVSPPLPDTSLLREMLDDFFRRKHYINDKERNLIFQLLGSGRDTIDAYGVRFGKLSNGDPAIRVLLSENDYTVSYPLTTSPIVYDNISGISLNQTNPRYSVVISECARAIPELAKIFHNI